MSNFLEDMAYRQYENKLPENGEVVYFCHNCNNEIFEGERCHGNGRYVFCHSCFIEFDECIAEREDF